ncbi:MAG: 30S ribosomal protein S9 [Candidatus Omnitrophota bacterium]
MTQKAKKLITGRRKEAVARVKLISGEGKITINKRLFEEYFPIEGLRLKILQPLTLAGVLNKYNVIAQVDGGGIAGQSGALCHGIARALIIEDEKLRPVLKKAGFLCRDARRKERKKYGQKGARKQFQFSKR